MINKVVLANNQKAKLYCAKNLFPFMVSWCISLISAALTQLSRSLPVHFMAQSQDSGAGIDQDDSSRVLILQIKSHSGVSAQLQLGTKGHGLILFLISLWPDMEKDIFLHKQSYSQNKFYLKICINWNNSAFATKQRKMYKQTTSMSKIRQPNIYRHKDYVTIFF